MWDLSARVPLRRWPYVGVRLVKNGLLQVPGVARLDERRHARRTGRMYDVRYVLSILRIHMKRLLEAGLAVEGSRGLEMGPGNSLGQAFILCLYGAARVTAIDVHPYADEKTGGGVYGALVDAAGRGLPEELDLPCLPEDWRAAAAELLPAGARFPHLGGRMAYDILRGPDLPLPDGSIDFAYSCSVLEHLPDPERTYGELARVVRPGGAMSHIIDLKDHHSSDPFDFLRYGDRLWRRMQEKSAGFTNRLRESDHLRLMEQAGFQILSVERRSSDAPPCREDLDPRFHGYDERDLRTLTTIVSARRL